MKVLIVGYGPMGKIIESSLSKKNIVGIVSKETGICFTDVVERPDVIIDFSNPYNLHEIANYASANDICVVIGTTGHNKEQLQEIKNLSRVVPVLMSENYSISVLVMKKVVEDIALTLKDFDVSVLDYQDKFSKHEHSQTSLLLKRALDKIDGKDVSIHSIKGGNLEGVHEVSFYGMDEVIRINHQTTNKFAYANGAIFGAKWLMKKEAGLYDFADCVFGGEENENV